MNMLITPEIQNALDRDDPKALETAAREMLGASDYTSLNSKKSLYASVIQKALTQPKLPKKCLRRAILGIDNPGYIWLKPLEGDEPVDWQRALNWWIEQEDLDPFPAISEAFDLAVWNYTNTYSPDRNDKTVQFIHQTLEFFGKQAKSEHDFLLKAKIHPKTGILMLMAALFPENTWIARQDVNRYRLLCDCLNDPLQAFRLLDPHSGESLLRRWRKFDPENETAFQEVAKEYNTNFQKAESWMEKWLPNGNWQDSPLQTWCSPTQVWSREPQLVLDENHPLHGLLQQTSTLTNQKVVSTLRKLFETHHTRSLSAVLQQLVNSVNELTSYSYTTGVEYPPDIIGYCLSAGREHSGAIRWLEKHANTENGRHEILDFLKSPYREQLVTEITRGELITWSESHPDWIAWRSETGKSLFEIWRRKNQDLRESDIKRIDAIASSWLYEPETDGTCAIDNIPMREGFRVELKRQHLADIGKARTPSASNKPRI